MYQVSCFYHKMHDSSQNCYISAPLYVVYISQLFPLAIVCCNVDDFNNRNHVLTAKLFESYYRYHKIRKAFF